MVVTPLAVQGLDINLPKTEAKEIELENTLPFVIDVSEDGYYFIEEDNEVVQVSLGFLEDRFSRVISLNPEVEVIIRGDGAADYQSIAELLAALQSNGANNFSLATQP
jgi:biopolymer transport protein TolR